MSDTVKLIIEIPTDYYEIIKHDVENHLTDYRPFEIIGNGIPLDSVKAEMEHAYRMYPYTNHGILEAISIIDMYIAKIDKNDKSCSTCKNNDDELSGECYECLKGMFDHYEPEDEKTESEDK